MPNDITMIENALRLFFQLGDVFEIRALDAVTPEFRRAHVESGYFDYDHIPDAAKAVSKLQCRGVYVTVNPVNTALLARSANRIQPAGRDAASKDSDVLCRRWLLVDCDPVRPSGISSTDAEHARAFDKAMEIRDGLKTMGFPEPIVCDSGNGAQLMYRVDLPCDDGGLIQACLKELAKANSDHVQIDQTVHNPARIWRLPGTMNCKGDSLPERPHRLATILEAPERLEIISGMILKKLANTVEASSAQDCAGTVDISAIAEPAPSKENTFRVDEWIAKHCPDVLSAQPWNGGRKWVFPVCPFNSEHTNRSAAIFEHASGAIAFACRHNGCKNYGWAELRELKEPAFKQTPKQKTETPKPAPPKNLILVNAAEWLKENLPVPAPIVEGIIDKGNKVQIIGDSKLGKSWFNLNLAVAIASGAPFLNWIIPSPKKVLLVQLEIGGVYYQKRLRLVAEAMQVPTSSLGRLDIINGRGLSPLLEGEIFKELMEVASKYDVVFIDPLYKVHSGDENKADDMKRPLLAFDRICEASGAAVVYTHHNQKGLSGDRKLVDRGSGSGILARDYDTMISLSPHVQKDLLVLDAITRNYPSPQPMSLVRDTLFRIVDVEPEELTSQSAGEKKKLTMLEAMDRAASAGIIEPGESLKTGEVDDRLVSLCDMSVRMAKNVRSEMVKLGKWELTPGRGNSELYRLASEHE